MCVGVFFKPGISSAILSLARRSDTTDAPKMTYGLETILLY